MASGSGTKDDLWMLATAPGSSEHTMYRDEQADPPALVCQVGSTTLKYHLRAIEDLQAWLTEQGDWVPLGAADEKKPAADGTVEAWAGLMTTRSAGGMGCARATGAGGVRIGVRRGQVWTTVPPRKKQPKPPHLDALKEEVIRRWGVVSLLGLLTEADRLTGFHTDFRSIAPPVSR